MKLCTLFKLVTTVAISMWLTACAIQNENEQVAGEQVNKAQQLYEKQNIKQPDSLVSTTEQLFISNDAIKVEKKVKLPAKFNETLLYTTEDHEPLQVTISNIAKMTQQPIVLDDSALLVLDQKSKNKTTTKGASGLTSYQGNLKTVLDQICNEYNLFWEYGEGKVQIFYLMSKVYALDAPINSFNLTDQISSTSDLSGSSDSSGSSSSSSVGGNSSMSLQYTTKEDSPWKAAITTITSMLSSNGKITSDPVEGFITIHDTPKIQRKVSRYIDKINNRTNKKIAVRVDVYDVQDTSTSDFGFQLDAVIDALSDSEIEISNDTASFLNPDNDGFMTSFTFKNDGGNNDTIMQALNTIGKTTEVTGATVYTVSGQPAPIQSTTSTNYLASSSTTVNDNTTTTSLTPGTVTTGYSMTVTPRMQSNTQILISLDLQISTLVELQTFTANDGTDNEQEIQLPETKNKNFLENMVLHSGQSILIAGFKDDSLSTGTASPSAIDMWAAGGAKTTQRSNATTVIVVTPYLIGGP